MKIRLPLLLLVSSMLVVMVIVVGGTIAGVAYFMSIETIEHRARDTVQRVTADVQQDLKYLLNPALDAVRILGQTSLGEASSLTERLQRLGLIAEVLNDTPILTSIQVGYENGDFFSVRRLPERARDRSPTLPGHARFEVESIDRGVEPPRERLFYYDADLRLLRESAGSVDVQGYDPREQEWYQKAWRRGPRNVAATTPYLLYGTNDIGTTASMRTTSGSAVVSVDVTFGEVSGKLWKERITPHALLALVNAQGHVVASDAGPGGVQVREPRVVNGRLEMPSLASSGIPLLAALDDRVSAMKGDNPYSARMVIDDVAWRVNVVPFDLPNLPPAMLISAVPERELLAEPYRQLTIYIWITIGFIVCIIPVALLFAHRVTLSLRELNKEAQSIQNFDFSGTRRIHSTIQEVDRVANTIQTMKQTIHRFREVSRAVSSETDFDKLLQTLLRETVSATGSTSGVLYLSDEQKFVPTAALGPGKPDIATMQSLPLDDPGPLVLAALRTGEPISGPLANDAMASLGHIPEADSGKYMVAAPLLNRQRKLLGLILLFQPAESTQAQLSFIRALTDSSAVSLETRELIKDQKALFEAFIQLIAGAIDAKSPYTGAHCRRVPELTKMLVRAACSATHGPYSDFELNESEWEAVHLAAWLHDCGKVVTPVHVVDKATKLETIHNRIHEIRTRFEVLRRDAKIACLETIAAGGDAEDAHAALEAENRQLDEDFAFIASCNTGGEFLSPEHVARLRHIGARAWVRTFDDRLGLSYEESARVARIPPAPLPATEQLLQDKEEHKIGRGKTDQIPDDNPWGFRIQEPEFLQNNGELYNLSIARGTLTEEERYIINQHITHTIMMLSALPFPKHLRGVADIAGGHHEKMDGTGYPRGLKKGELTPVSRMMAIADIFEALTAIDRPYKRGKTLSEAIKIMHFMKRDHHIDPELFDLFLHSGVYQAYAEQYMKPEQIDEVDIAAFAA